MGEARSDMHEQGRAEARGRTRRRGTEANSVSGTVVKMQEGSLTEEPLSPTGWPQNCVLFVKRGLKMALTAQMGYEEIADWPSPMCKHAGAKPD